MRRKLRLTFNLSQSIDDRGRICNLDVCMKCSLVAESGNRTGTEKAL